MDRNSILGLILIGLLVIGYSIYTQPSEEQLKLEQATRDSLAAVSAKASVIDSSSVKYDPTTTAQSDSGSAIVSDSLEAVQLKEKWGEFHAAVEGQEQLITLENNQLKVVVSSLGGRIKSATLKEYKTWDGQPVELLSSDSSNFNIAFSAGNRVINTSELHFQAMGTTGSSSAAIFRLNAGDDRYLEFNYKLPATGYLLSFNIRAHGLEQIIAPNATYLNLDWKDELKKQENSLESERGASTIYYRFSDDEVDYISETKDEEQSLKTKV
ncbi:MAG: YidC/Oxa1 family insertase periplasmic-domain containing protein, partial [Flavobacteriales bacterium]